MTCRTCVANAEEIKITKGGTFIVAVAMKNLETGENMVLTGATGILLKLPAEVLADSPIEMAGVLASGTLHKLQFTCSATNTALLKANAEEKQSGQVEFTLSGALYVVPLEEMFLIKAPPFTAG